MGSHDEEERLLHSTAIRNAASILQARQRAEEELLGAKAALEARSLELARSVSVLRATLESTTDAILVVDNEGTLADYNERFLDVWSLDRARLQGLRYSELLELIASKVDGACTLLSPEHAWREGHDETFETLDLVDGRVVECFSTAQIVEAHVIGRVWSFRDVTERTRTEAALRASHARFAAIIDQSPVGILLVDAELRLQHVNPTAAPVFGGTHLLIGRSFDELMHVTWPDAVANEILEHCRHTLETGEPYHSRAFSQIRKDRGVEKHYDWELHRVDFPGGQQGVACYFIDVTSHVLAQRALQASERRVRATFEQAAVGMTVVNRDGRFVEMNRKFTRILGYSEAELRERTFVDITHPDDVEESREHVARLLRGEAEDFSIEKRYVRKDGSFVWSLTTIALLRNDDGRISELVGVIEDISQRKLVEERISETAQRLHIAMSAGHLGDWVWNAQTDVVTLGSRAASVFGLPEGRPITWTQLRALLHVDDRERARIAVETALRDHADYNIEYRVNKPSGEEVWLAAKGRGVYGNDGSIHGMVGVVQDVTDRKRLESFRFRLAAVVETSDDAIVSKTLKGVITTWNQGAQRMFGYTAEEIVGQSVTVLIPAARQYEEVNILRRIMAGERIEHYETIRVRKDGTEFPISLTVSPVKDDDGNIIGVSKIARDVTVRKRAEEALHEESRVLNLLNQTGKAIAADLDLHAIVQTVTDAATQLSGAEFGAFFFNTPDGKGDAFQLFTLSGASKEALEELGRRGVSTLVGPAFDVEGPIRIDDALADSRFGKSPPYHGTPEGHLPVRSCLAAPVVSRTGEMIGRLLFGHSAAGVFTARIEQLVLGIAAQAAVAIDNARLYERVKRAADERQVLLEAERAARAETDRVSLVKDEFLATLSHELRTPLNAIVGWAHVLRTSTQTSPEVIEGLTVIDRNAKVQAQLIEDLLDMSRIVSGKVRLDVQRVELQEVVKSAVESVRHSAESKGIRLQTVIDPLAGPVRGDPNRLQQCLWNLLTNAIKFTPKGGQVQVSLARVNSHLELSVVDTGQGIPQEFLPHVFERFRQADASTTRRHGGLGLGLSIVKSLVELHGGSVRVSSAGKDQGATFCIELPLMVVDTSMPSVASQHPRAGGAGGSMLDHPSLHGIVVLVVDDKPDARNLVRRVLEDCGARVLLAESAKDGLAVLCRERPHMLISDIGMPDEDGYEFIRRVRQLPPEQGGRTPAAALSAFARAEDRTRALRAGYQTHIAKPVEPTELTAVIASLAARQ